MQALRLSSQIQEDMSHALGLTVCHSNEIVQSHFSDGVLIVWYINKMATNGGGGVVDVVTLRRLQAILVPG